jgi:hypothetical protein
MTERELVVKIKRFTTAAVLSLALMSGSVGVAQADTTASATSNSTYNDQVAAYKIAMDNYKIALQQYNTNWKKAQIAYKSALATWAKDGKSILNSLKSKRDLIGLTFKTSIQNANSAFAAAMASARTADQKNAAKSARTTAINDATAARNVALDALKLSSASTSKPNPPVKPAEPIKPIPPIKPSVTSKVSSPEKKEKKDNKKN